MSFGQEEHEAAAAAAAAKEHHNACVRRGKNVYQVKTRSGPPGIAYLGTASSSGNTSPCLACTVRLVACSSDTIYYPSSPGFYVADCVIVFFFGQFFPL